MMPRRSEPYVTRVDWTALALLAAGLLVALCVFSYRPAPPTLDSAAPGAVAGGLGLAGGLLLALDTPIFAVTHGVQFVTRRIGRRLKSIAARVLARSARSGATPEHPLTIKREPPASDEAPAIDALVREIVADSGPVP